MLSQRLGGIAEAGPLVKIAQTQNNQSLQELAVDILGPVAIANDGNGLPAHVAYGFLRSRANSIGGGTSEVLRNIVGESMLGLPREPDPYRGQPWSAIPRS